MLLRKTIQPGAAAGRDRLEPADLGNQPRQSATRRSRTRSRSLRHIPRFRLDQKSLPVRPGRNPGVLGPRRHRPKADCPPPTSERKVHVYRRLRRKRKRRPTRRPHLRIQSRRRLSAPLTQPHQSTDSTRGAEVALTWRSFSHVEQAVARSRVGRQRSRRRRRCEEAGMEGFLAKPLSMAGLSEALAKLNQ
jgi:hypothetical protein